MNLYIVSCGSCLDRQKLDIGRTDPISFSSISSEIRRKEYNSDNDGNKDFN